MPIRTAKPVSGTVKNLRNHSFEHLCCGWLMQDEWHVYKSVLDDGHSTDLLISDSKLFHKIQIKTVESQLKHIKVSRKWPIGSIDFVIYFSVKSNWGYMCPAFSEAHRWLDHKDHRFFNFTKNDFLKAFHAVRPVKAEQDAAANP